MNPEHQAKKEHQVKSDHQVTDQPPLSSNEAKALCQNIFATSNELISLLEEETTLLRNAKTKHISPLNVRKDALTAALSHHMEKFKQHADQVRQLAPQELQNLEQQRSHFQKSIETNHAALIAVQAVSERILQTVADKVSRKQGGPEVYTAGGQVTQAGIKRSAAINVDTAL